MTNLTTDEMPRLPRIRITEEPVPCGICVTTQYLDADGTLIRQDIEVKVDKAALLRGMTGETES